MIISRLETKSQRKRERELKGDVFLEKTKEGDFKGRGFPFFFSSLLHKRSSGRWTDWLGQSRLEKQSGSRTVFPFDLEGRLSGYKGCLAFNGLKMDPEKGL